MEMESPSTGQTREDRIVAKMADRRAKKDLQYIIETVLNLSLYDGAVTELLPGQSMQSLSKANTTVMTRIVLNTAAAAIRGDLQAAKLLWEFGGMKPIERKEAPVELPIFIDDMSDTSDPAPRGENPFKAKKMEASLDDD